MTNSSPFVFQLNAIPAMSVSKFSKHWTANYLRAWMEPQYVKLPQQLIAAIQKIDLLIRNSNPAWEDTQTGIRRGNLQSDAYGAF